MGPKPKKPRLATIDARVMRAVIDLVGGKIAGDLTVGLVLYATGVAGVEPVHEQLAGMLYGTALDGRGPRLPEDVVVGKEPDRPIDVVLLAAQARHDIETGRGVTVRGLACLASVSPQFVGQALVPRRMKDGRPRIPARSAAKWLHERGIRVLVKGVR